jgi:hypothetical protein
MRGLSVYLSYSAVLMGLFAAAQSVPAPRTEAAAVEAAPVRGAVTVDEEASQASRFTERAKLEQALAEARPPVPLLREFKLTPFYSPEAVEPAATAVAQLPSTTTPASSALPPVQSAKSEPVAKAKIEQVVFRSVRLIEREPDGKWRAVGLRGNTEVALVVDAGGNVSMQ